MEEDLLQLEMNKELKDQQRLSKVVLVRHAESLANKEGIYQGQTHDTDLSPLGQLQAQAVARRLAELGIRHVVSSPLKRTFQTAIEIAKCIDCDVTIESRIIETNHGIWEGKHKNWIAENYGDIYSLWLTKPSAVVFPGGESFMETVARVQSFLSDTALDEDTILVTHDNIIRIALALSANLDLDLIWRFELESAALNFFEKTNKNGQTKLRLLMANDVRHLNGLRAEMKDHAL